MDDFYETQMPPKDRLSNLPAQKWDNLMTGDKSPGQLGSRFAQVGRRLVDKKKGSLLVEVQKLKGSFASDSDESSLRGRCI